MLPVVAFEDVVYDGIELINDQIVHYNAEQDKVCSCDHSEVSLPFFPEDTTDGPFYIFIFFVCM